MVPLQEVAYILIALLAVLLLLVKIIQDKINRKLAEQVQRLIRINGARTIKWDHTPRGCVMECLPENPKQES